MVRVQPEVPRAANGTIDVTRWARDMQARHRSLDGAGLTRTAQVLAAVDAAVEGDVLPQGLELASMLADMNLDHAAVMTGLVYRGVRSGRLGLDELENLVSAEVLALTEAVLSLATTSLLEMSNSSLHAGEQDSQVENVKRMLVAMVDDARVAVIKLAERVLALRHAKHMAPERRLRVATEAKTVFAPLAGRLGIGQLKWELEDLSLRYTAEATYKAIATQLQGKRGAREAQVQALVGEVQDLLRSQGLSAEVTGRAKHIYSIFRKMRAKQVDFDEVYDVRAVRVIVDTLAECYASLSTIHSRWEHIPAEFDDYVSNPKENGYQSIHTAVLLEDGETLEIQIRTAAMHADAELGVCAHWSYKGASDQGIVDQGIVDQGMSDIGTSHRAAPDSSVHAENVPGSVALVNGTSVQSAYDAKMDWLRQVMEWHEELGGTEKLSTLLEHRVNDDRIFVSTPRGHVLELPVGATVLDFAYRVHTDIGHACRGATVNQLPATLDQQLANSQQIAVQTEDGGEPHRLWLEKPLALIQTDRARAKVVSFFRARSSADKRAVAQRLIELARQGLSLQADAPELMQQLRSAVTLSNDEAMLEQLATGEIAFFDACGIWLNQPGATPSVAIEIDMQGINRDGLLLEITQRLASLGLALTATQGSVSNGAQQAIISVETKVADWRERVKVMCHLALLPGLEKIITKNL